METVVLLDNETATGTAKTWQGGFAQVQCSCAGYNGGSAKLQVLGPDGLTWMDVTNGTFAANGIGDVSLPRSCKVRGAVITAVPSSGVYMRLYERGGGNR